MKKRNRKILYAIGAVAILIIVSGIAANLIIKNKIKKALDEDLPENIAVQYDDLIIKTLQGSVELVNPIIFLKNEGNGEIHTQIQANDLKIERLSYWKYLFSKEISVDGIVIEKPELLYYKDKVEKREKDSSSTKSSKLKREISLRKIAFSNGNFQILDQETDSVFFLAQNVSFLLSDINITRASITNKIPFSFKNVNLEGDSLFVKAGKYELLALQNFKVDRNNSDFKNIHLYTKYSREELNRIIPHERDHYNLHVQNVSLNDHDYSFAGDSLKTSAKKITINDVDFDVYRDKTITKDTTFKPLYNRSLRNLPFDLAVDSLLINGADIVYTERHQEENQGGIITFKKLNAKIANVGNTYKDPINADIEAYFMDETPFQANWKLFVQDPSDHFAFRAQIQKFNAARMNAFVEPNLYAKLEGEASQTFFTIDGNNENSHTDVKIKYSGLKVSLLKKDHDKKHFLSALVNVVIPKNSKEKGAEFNDGTGETDRHKTQSVFNQLWISLESALKDAILPGIIKTLTE